MPAIGGWLDALGGAVLVVVGVWIATLRPRRTANVAFSVFLMGLGVTAIASNFGAELGVVALVPAIAAAFVAGVAAVAFALTFPRPIARGERGVVVAAAAGGVLLGAVVMTTLGGGDVVSSFGWAAPVLWSSYLFIGVLSAQRFRGAPTDREAAQLAVVSAATVMLVGVRAGMHVLSSDPAFRTRGWALMVFVAVVLLAWIVNTIRSGPPRSRYARNVALVVSALPLAGLGVGAWVGERATDSGALGAARMVAAGLLTYALLKLQLFDLDVKIKWTIKQSTVAAAFIAVFFIVSESASAFFAGRVGTYVGIAAAGLLVFALAPLQRAAEGLANIAMPNVRAADADYVRARKREAYRTALDLAWADGTLSEREARHLRTLRETLGLDVADYDALERERESASPPPA